jgi:hypothetical protein
MRVREELQKRIEKKEQEIAMLQIQLREASAYLQALQDTLKLLPRDGINDGGATELLRPGSAMWKAREAIQKAGAPLHINELLKALGKSSDKKSRVSLSGSIAGYARKGEVFVKTAPNTFGLIELGHRQHASIEIPDSFGETEDNPELSKLEDGIDRL